MITCQCHRDGLGIDMGRAAISNTAGKTAFFYGWRIVALGYVINLMSAGIGSSGFSVIVKPMGDDLDWNRSWVVAGATLGMLAAAVFGHYVGSLLDKRHGARVVTTLGTFVIGLAMIGVGQVREIWQFLLLFFIAGMFGLYSFPILVVPTMVSKWFIRKRGMAISFASMGLPSSGLLISPYTNLLVSSLSWRAAWTVLGLTMWALVTPWVFLFMRRTPEDLNLRPDGASNPAATGGLIGASPRRGWEDEYPWTIREATRTRAFWLILLGTSLGFMSFLAVLINFFAYATDSDHGFTSGEATIAFATFSGMSLVGKLPWAFLADRIDIRYSTSFTYAFPAIAIALLLNADNFWMLVLWGVLFGIGVSGISPLPALIWGNYYGRTFLGSIRGVTSPVAFLTQAGAPLFAALMFDLTGGYEVSFVVFLSFLLLASALMLFAKPPRRRR